MSAEYYSLQRFHSLIASQIDAMGTDGYGQIQGGRSLEECLKEIKRRVVKIAEAPEHKPILITAEEVTLCTIIARMCFSSFYKRFYEGGNGLRFEILCLTVAMEYRSVTKDEEEQNTGS